MDGRLVEAEPPLRDALVSAPDDPQLLLALGCLCVETGRPREALGHLGRVLERPPAPAGAWLYAGRALLDLGELEEARRALEEARRREPGRMDTLLTLGEVEQRSGRARAAVDLYRQAVAAVPEHPLPQLRLGFELLRGGDLEGAEAALSGALALAPEAPEALGGLALIRERAGDAEGALALTAPRVEAGAVEPRLVAAHAWATSRVREGAGAAVVAVERALAAGPPPADEALLCHALGDLLDREGRHAEAFASYSRGNAARAQRFDGPRHRAEVAELMRRLPGARLASLPRSGLDSERPLLIVGLPRSGTSLVEQILSSHPAVAGGGELDDWRLLTRDLAASLGAGPWTHHLEALTSEHVRAAGAAYLARLDAVDPVAARVTDKMPDNALFLGLVALATPGARVVHCLRDEVDAGWSAYRQLFGGGLAWTTSLSGIGHYVRAYSDLMAHWEVHLPLRLHQVVYEDLVADLEGHARALVAFAGLEWNPACLDFHRSGRAMATASYAQVQRPVYRSSVGRSAPYRRWLGPLLEVLEDPGVP